MTSELLPLCPEIIDRVVGELVLDRPHLRACSLVSPAFRHSAQKRLFNSIDISASTHKSLIRMRELYDVLLKNPQLSMHIKVLNLSCGPCHGNTESLDHIIIKKLSNLCTLNMYGHEGHSSWACFTAETQTALFNLARCAPITTIDMEEITGWPITFLQHCTYLKHLRIRAFCDPFVNDAALDQQRKASHTGTQFRLEELQLKTFPSPILFSCIGKIHPTLRTLAFTCDRTRNTAHFAAMIQLCAHSLERLIVLHYTGTDTGESFTTDIFTGLTNLRRLSVKGGKIEASKSLITLLKNTAGVHPIEEISIRFDDVDEFSPSSDVVWEELNSCFMQHLEFPHLRAVYINLPTYIGPEGMELRTEFLEGFYATLSCIGKNPHIFHIRGYKMELLQRLKEESEQRLR